jgi:Ribbon-helix-helix protein, copG family
MNLKNRVITIRLDVDLSEAIERQRELHGTPVSEQVRRALRAWFESQGIMKAERRRGPTRKRS